MNAFVIMPFRPELDSIYESVIIPACRKFRIEAVRADKILDPGSIPDQIVKAIRDASFVIAEISQENDNVFYELGYAHALGKKAVLLSNRDRHLPFDVRVNRTIIYDCTVSNYVELLRDPIESAINNLLNIAERLTVGIKDGDELEGQTHTLSGCLKNVSFPCHLWFFARADRDTWWPQDDGELRVASDGSWEAQFWLGREDRVVDIARTYDLAFGLVSTSDNRSLTELAVVSKFTHNFAGLRDLPASFEELARLRIKRVKR